MLIQSAAAEDDAMLVKHVGQSFRFSAVEVLNLIHSLSSLSYVMKLDLIKNRQANFFLERHS